MKVKEFCNVDGGNSGLIEEVVYNNPPKDESDAVTVMSASLSLDTAMGKVSKSALTANGKPLKIHTGDCLLTTRKGKAGNIVYVKDATIAINDDAYIISIKPQYKDEMDVRFFSLQYPDVFKSCVSSEDGNGTFSKTLFLEQDVEYPFPDIDKQREAVNLYEKLEHYRLVIEGLLQDINILENSAILISDEERQYHNGGISEMARPRKEAEYLSCRLDKIVFDKLEELCEDIGLTKTKAVEKAIEKYYDEYKQTGKV